jgi:hypothetical protein
MPRGSCLCGGIRFECDAVPIMTHCHCSMCRKSHAAAFGTFANVYPHHFRWLAGEELVQRYASSPGNLRSFCRVCGSKVPVYMEGMKLWGVPAGLFDDDPGVRPCLHMMVAWKAPWWELADALPKFDEWVPGFGPGDER